jgi:xanthine/CO dehydrogenase XdhC/CoxF family maturation factor
MSLHRLLPLFDRARAVGEPLVLATVIRTGGSTYAKPGAQMLIAADGEYAGLLSGGCLEGDLREHARTVAATGEGRIVSYDLRSSTDQLFGLGAGCEGAMDILLTRVGAGEYWQPLEYMAAAARRGDTCRVVFVTASRDTAIPLGMNFPDANPPPNGSKVDSKILALRDVAVDTAGNSTIRVRQPDVELFVADAAPPPRLLLLGGGPDTRPVAELASFLGWRVTTVDHRATYLAPGRFPPGTELIETPASELTAAVRLDDFAAAVVMSHHLHSDLQYLRALAHSRVPYVGLLGPAARREKLLGDLGEDARGLRPRLRAPVGLDIGGRAPESIALSIVGEIHAALAGRGGRPFSETLKHDAAVVASGHER